MKHIKTFESFNDCGCDKLIDSKSNYKLSESLVISEDLQYHIDNDLPLIKNIFRTGSDKFFNIINEARELFNNNKIDLSEDDKEIINTDLGKLGIYEGNEVYLDLPMINEAEYKGKKVDLNKPKRNSGSGKKYYVYVNGDKGNVIKVSFGDVKGGLTAKVSDPKARASFAARHDCKNKKDKTKAGYWSCRINRFSSIFGKSYPGYW